MRAVLNLSVPQKTAETIKSRAKNYGFSSLSEYIRFLLDLDEDLISPEELLKISTRADREYKAGSVKKFKSLADLL